MENERPRNFAFNTVVDDDDDDDDDDGNECKSIKAGERRGGS